MSTEGTLPAALGTGRETARRGLGVVKLLVALIVLAGAGYGASWWWRTRGRRWWHERSQKRTRRATYTVRRGDLPIIVTEKGNLKALKSEIIKCQVEGRSTIIRLVDEGTVITPEDVSKGRLLIELDSAELRERLTQQEITHATAKAAYETAKEAYDIQKSQGESNVNEARLNVKFRRMDLGKYVGETLAARALDKKVDLLDVGRKLCTAAVAERKQTAGEIDRLLAGVHTALREAAAKSRESRTPSAPGGLGDAEAAPARSHKAPRLRTRFGDGHDKDIPDLGGTALQDKRKLEADIDLAVEDFKTAADDLVWTAKLWSYGYKSSSDLEVAQLGVKRNLITLEQALSAREIFLRYEFPKQAEELISLYVETQREMSRVEARSRSTLAQKEADRDSKEATYRRQKSTLDKLNEQVAKCTVRAEHPGIVVYATSVGRRHSRSSSSPVEVGATVYQRQELIHLPDVSTLAVSVGIHESAIDKVTEGLEALIHVNALPNTALKGKVHKVAILPTSQSWWNPNLKEYDTDITIEQTHPSLKPGMSARVEIRVKTLQGVLVVPVQTVAMRRGKPVVYVLDGATELPTEVQVGESDEKFVEIRSGLTEGDVILLEAPQIAAEEEEKEKDEEEEKGETNGESKGPLPPGPPRPALRPGARPTTAGPPRRPGGSGTRPGGPRTRPKGRRPPGTARGPRRTRPTTSRQPKAPRRE